MKPPLKTRSLDLSGRGIRELHPQVRNLLNLTTRIRGENNPDVLPPEIGKLVNLEILSLSGNCLTKLPDEIANLPRLKGLEWDADPLPEEEKERIPNLPPGVGVIF